MGYSIFTIVQVLEQIELKCGLDESQQTIISILKIVYLNLIVG
ncbi:hypothetical protein [Neobacillus drentensis]